MYVHIATQIHGRPNPSSRNAGTAAGATPTATCNVQHQKQQQQQRSRSLMTQPLKRFLCVCVCLCFSRERATLAAVLAAMLLATTAASRRQHVKVIANPDAAAPWPWLPGCATWKPEIRNGSQIRNAWDAMPVRLQLSLSLSSRCLALVPCQQPIYFPPTHMSTYAHMYIHTYIRGCTKRPIIDAAQFPAHK